MFRRALSSLVLLSIVCLVLAGCTGPASPASPGAPSGSGEVITWKVQNQMPTGTGPWNSLERISAEVVAASGGRLEFKPFPGGGVVPAEQEFDGVDSNAIQGALITFPQLLSLFPSAALFAGRVGGMEPVQMLAWHTQGGGHELQQKMLEGFDITVLKGCGFTEPPEIWCHSRVPITSLADINGLKMRTFGDGGAILDRMGASTVMITAGEVYESMNRGVIDACEAGGAYNNWNMGWQEVAPYIYLSGTRSPGLFTNFVVNSAAFEDLPEDLSLIVESVTRQEALRYFTILVLQDAEYLQKFVDYGTTIESLPQDVADELLRTADQYYNEMAGKDDFFKQVLESQRTFEKVWNDYVGRM